jgi:hypothetical protein
MEDGMALITIILLGLILMTLICIMLICAGSLHNLQKQSESIHGILNDTLQYTRLLEENIKDKVGHIYNMSTDMKFHQKKLREHEMAITIETLKGIESNLSDLKLIHDTLISLKRSLDLVAEYPTITAKSEDTDKN